MIQAWVLGDPWLVQVCKMHQNWGTLAHVKNNEQNPIFLYLKKNCSYTLPFDIATIVSQVLLFQKGKKAVKCEDWTQSCPHVPATGTKPSWFCVLISHYNGQCVYGLSPKVTFEKEWETNKSFSYLLYWQESHPVYLSVQSPSVWYLRYHSYSMKSKIFTRFFDLGLDR